MWIARDTFEVWVMQGEDERSIGELLAQLSQETAELMRRELRLTEAEMTQKAYRAGKNAGFLVAGGAVAYAGLLATMAGLIMLLGRQRRRPWLSSFLVGLSAAGAGALLALKGLDALKQEGMIPRETVETLEENREWLKDQTDRTR
ncbi:MAG: phage holin family protein [Actinomycetota bacterium]|nr:phage holin family protein [Actinomycetota bacterium]